MTPAQASLPPALTALIAQVKGNPRLQIGLGVIALILAGWVFLLLGDVRAARVAELERDHERLAQIKQLAKQKGWTKRAIEAEELRRVLDAELPQAKSAGLAQAEFQGWLRGVVTSQGGDVRIETQAPMEVESVPGVVQVTSVVSGALPPDRVIQMLQRIESHAQLIAVPLATIRDDGVNRTFSLTVRGFYRVAGPDQTPPSP